MVSFPILRWAWECQFWSTMFLFPHTVSQLSMVRNYKKKTTRGAYGEDTLKEAL